MLWLEEKYIGFIGSRLSLFKKVKHGQWAFRCPICGDSKKSASKTRGGFYLAPDGQSYNMGCFNCGASMKFSSFLKMIDPVLSDEYRLEDYREKHQSIPVKTNAPKPIPKPEPKKPSGVLSLDRVDKLPNDHPVIKYLLGRKLPRDKFDRLYVVPKYVSWIRSMGEKMGGDEHPRLVMPFFDSRGNVTRFTARAFDAREPKYLYTVVQKESSRVYGMDIVKKDELCYVLEGPLDSLFFDNAVAVGTASYKAQELLELTNRVIVPDNQPRNRDVCKNLEYVINRGDRVCLWQEETPKDINDMIKAGYTIDSIKSLIERSTFSGLDAMFMFKKWAKY